MIWVVVTLLVLSVLANIGLVIALLGVTDKMNSYLDFAVAAEDKVIEFADHLEFVNGLERYYGDETLQGLLGHTEVLSKDLRMLVEHGVDASEEMVIRDQEESAAQAED